MNVPALLLACYPPPVRQRWGEQLQAEVEHGGPRRWANVAVGAVGLWLSPSTWPVPTSQQRRAVLTVTGAVILGAAALLLRAVTGDEPEASAAAATLTAALCGLLLGAVLLCPTPPLHWNSLLRLARQAIGALWLPALLTLAIVAFAHQPGTDTLLANPLIRAGCVATYWATLLLGVVQTCRLCSSLLTGTARPPAPWRLRAGLRISAVSLLIAAAACVTPTSDSNAAMPAAATLLTGLAVIALLNSTNQVDPRQ